MPASVRPEWRLVSVLADLNDLAAAFTLEAMQTTRRLALDASVAAAQTRAAGSLIAQGTWSTDAGLSWIDAGRRFLAALIAAREAQA